MDDNLNSKFYGPLNPNAGSFLGLFEIDPGFFAPISVITATDSAMDVHEFRPGTVNHTINEHQTNLHQPSFDSTGPSGMPDACPQIANPEEELMQEISSKKRNARERGRVRHVNDAYDHLREILPSHFQTNGKKMSKVDTLRNAAKYITCLSQALAGEMEIETKVASSAAAENFPGTKIKS